MFVCLDTAGDDRGKFMHAIHSTLPMSNILAKNNMDSICFNIEAELKCYHCLLKLKYKVKVEMKILFAYILNKPDIYYNTKRDAKHC